MVYNETVTYKGKGDQQMKELQKDEVRIIRIPFSAVEEILFENLMDNGERYFSAKVNEENLFHMIFDEESGDLIYAISKFPEKIDFDVMKKATEITAESLFTPDIQFYVTKKMSELTKEN